MTNHTPKPQWIAEWPIVDGNRCGHPFVSERGERFIATMDFDSPEAFDCARLIAAAPDLLAACEACEQSISANLNPHHTAAVVARAAIAKARGRE